MDEPRTWADVARWLKSQDRGTQARLAKHLEMDASQVNRDLKTSKPLSVDRADAIAEFINGRATETDAPAIASGRRVAVYGYAAMGAAHKDDQGETLALSTADILDFMTLPAGIDPSGDCYVLIPVGESMEPRIFAGEPLLVLKGRPPTRNGDALIEFRDGTGVVKTYGGQRNGRVYGQQYNPPKMRDWDAATVKEVHRVIKL